MATKRIVSKFGGSSVGDAQAMRTTARLLMSQGMSPHIQPLAVSSAMFGTTDRLVEAVQFAATGSTRDIIRCRRKLHWWHINTVYSLLDSSSPLRRDTLEHIEETFETFFDKPLEEVMAKQKAAATHSDMVISMGERLSNYIIAQYIRSVAGDDAAAYVPSDEVVVTDGVPGNSAPLLVPTRQKMQERVLPMVERGTVPLITGFFGQSEDGLLTTFGRGGSDLTAALVGYSLDADEVALYKVEYSKDDEGFMREWTAGWEGIVHDADVTSTIPQVTYQVAAELAHFGKKVLHPSTVAPAVEKEIDLRVLNSLNHKHPGTKIAAPTIGEMTAASDTEVDADAEEMPPLTESDVDGVVSTITKTRVHEYESQHNRQLDLDNKDSDWMHDKEQSTLIAMVGLNIMEHKQNLLGRIEEDLKEAKIDFAVPDRVNGSSHNLSIVVPASRTKDTLGILHSELVLSSEQLESDASASDGSEVDQQQQRA